MTTEEQMCGKNNCKLCADLNELGNILKKRGELTRQILDKLGECFCH